MSDITDIDPSGDWDGDKDRQPPKGGQSPSGNPPSTAGQSPNWAMFEVEKGIQYIQHLFEQLLVMTRYSLLFNGALAAAATYLFTNIHGEYTKNMPLSLAGLFVSFIAVVFNGGALTAHNKSWDLIKRTSAYISRLEKDLGVNPDTSRRKFGLVTDLHEFFFDQDKGLTTRVLTQIFYGLLIAFGALYGLAIVVLLTHERLCT